MKEFVLDHPLILALALNNYDPVFGAKTPEFLDEAVYRKIRDCLEADANRGVLVLTGGEPILPDRRLKEMVSFARSRGWVVSEDTWAGFEERPRIPAQISRSACAFFL